MKYVLILIGALTAIGNLRARNRPGSLAAVAAVERAAADHGGHMVCLPCRECGRREVPPVAHLDSPVPMASTALMGLASGYVVTAVCRACSAPLISRVISAEDADRLRQLGAVDGDAVVGRFLAQLADL